jgi:hypothetical protein
VKGENLACPFFFPTDRADNIALPHPARLPLGAAWRGRCEASDEPCTPGTHELENCNLGYAQTCQRLPKERSCDAVRFGVARDAGPTISVRYILETAHQPAGDGSLEYDRSLGRWNSTYPEPRIQKMAECFLESYLDRADRGTRPLRTLAEIPLQDSKEQTTEGTDLTQSTIHSVKT